MNALLPVAAQEGTKETVATRKIEFLNYALIEK